MSHKMLEYWLLCLFWACTEASQNDTTVVLKSPVGYGFNGCCERPRRGSNKSITVEVKFGIFTINRIDEKYQHMCLNGWLHFKWQDDFLRWDANKYGFMRNIQSDQIWTPDVMIHNAHDNFGKIEMTPSRVIAYGNGTVEWYPGGRFTVICKISIRLFPFDNQTCDVLVGPWVDFYSHFRVMGNPELSGGFSVSDPEWNLTKTDHVIKDHNLIAFKFHLTRRYIFYVINIIVPLVIMSFLTNLVFILPSESGEKVSLSISILLAYVVLMNLISALLPTNSDQICLLSVYIIALMILSGLSTLATILELKVIYSRKKGSDRIESEISNFNKIINRLSSEKLNTVAFLFSVTSTLVVNIVFYCLLTIY